MGGALVGRRVSPHPHTGSGLWTVAGAGQSDRQRDPREGPACRSRPGFAHGRPDDSRCRHRQAAAETQRGPGPALRRGRPQMLRVRIARDRAVREVLVQQYVPGPRVQRRFVGKPHAADPEIDFARCPRELAVLTYAPNGTSARRDLGSRPSAAQLLRASRRPSRHAEAAWRVMQREGLRARDLRVDDTGRPLGARVTEPDSRTGRLSRMAKAARGGSYRSLVRRSAEVALGTPRSRAAA